MEAAGRRARGNWAEYIEREGDLLHGFAVHSALEEAIHAEHPDVWNWRSWPEPYQDPQSAATREFVQKHRRNVLFHKYLQWQLDSQLRAAQEHARERGLSIGLYHDLALATDRFGSDLWAHRGHYHCRLPGGSAAGRILAQGAGLGLSSA